MNLGIPSNKPVVSILSGGLDSTILTYALHDHFKEVLALTFSYGQKHHIEIEKAKTTCHKLKIQHQIIDISFLGKIVEKVSALSASTPLAMPSITEVLGLPQSPTYVPYRNLILISLGLSFAEANNCSHVFTGIQATDSYQYWDCSSLFINALHEITNLNRINSIEVCAPFVNKTKVEEIEIGKKLSVPFENTWTCYSGPNDRGEACGKCPSCSERIRSFAKAGLRDPCPYAIEIPWNDLIK